MAKGKNTGKKYEEKVSCAQYFLDQIEDNPELYERARAIFEESGQLELRTREIRSAEKLVEIIEKDPKVQEVMKGIAIAFGNGATTEYVLNTIGSQLVPGWTSYSIASLGPYLGRFTVDNPQMPIVG